MQYTMIYLTFLIFSVFMTTSRSSTIQTMVGQSVLLSCPMSETFHNRNCSLYQCEWTGPGDIHVSSKIQSASGSLRVKYNMTSCDCVLIIDNTNLDHAGVWSCAMENVTVVNRELSLQTLEQGENILNNNGSRKRQKIFYILFICLAVLAKVLLLSVIAFSIIMSCCPSRSRSQSSSPQENNQRSPRRMWQEEKHSNRIFNTRICKI